MAEFEKWWSIYLSHINTPTFLKISHSSYSHTYKDGPYRMFRKVGIYNSDAWILPRRKHTAFRTRRMFEITNYMKLCVEFFWKFQHEVKLDHRKIPSHKTRNFLPSAPHSKALLHNYFSYAPSWNGPLHKNYTFHFPPRFINLVSRQLPNIVSFLHIILLKLCRVQIFGLHLLTYLLTDSLHGAESFLRS